MKALRVAIATLVFGLVACSGPEPTLPHIMAASSGGSGTVTVSAAKPDSAPQDTSLDVHVLGAGFDRGSNAQWAQGGVVSANVKTNSTKFVSSSELVANITVALSAATGSYDILVTTSKGKKGIGSELFTITLKHNDVATVTVAPATNTIVVGSSVQLKATAYNSSGTVLSKATFTWATSNPSVAAVSATGFMTVVGQGSASITAGSGSASGNAAVTTVTSLALVAVSAGVHYSCGVTTTGATFCWGANDQSQLGNSSTIDVYGPSAVSGGLAFSSISIQYAGGCGLVAGGSAWCWGGVGEPTTSGGALGGGNGSAPVPIALVGGMSFTAISDADGQACGLSGSGAAYCWGWNRYGQLGTGTTTDSPIPAAVSGGLTFTMLSAGGDDHACGLTSVGVAYCWGANSSGQLGGPSTDTCTIPSGSPTPCSLTPIMVTGGLTFSALSAGTWGYTCGVTTSGAAYCWGSNSYGQLGNGTTTNSPTPVPVSGGLTFTAISAGEHTCGLAAGGVAYCWGFNRRGQLGNGGTTNSATPVAVSGGLAFASISAGTQHTCGFTAGGVAYCWGWNDRGQLGDGTQTDHWVPVKVLGQP
jgi:alpha-tubulin suppressor-like RCC1 family protein